ncbi:MAG: hypothetical protein AAB225_16820 [Acidobacteriota bacterium]
MSSRSHTTFKKRQKEQARKEKQLLKAAKRMQRKPAECPPTVEETAHEQRDPLNPPATDLG